MRMFLERRWWSPQVSRNSRHTLTDPLLYGDLVSIATPAVKWAQEVTHPDQKEIKSLHVPALWIAISGTASLISPLAVTTLCNKGTRRLSKSHFTALLEPAASAELGLWLRAQRLRNRARPEGEWPSKKCSRKIVGALGFDKRSALPPKLFVARAVSPFGSKFG